jgi:hypothetical protein
MDYGVLIDNYLELIRFHEDYDIYISRRSLKHFVESRKKEMLETHTEAEILDKLYFAVDNVILVYKKYDKIESTNIGRLIYTKKFENIQKINIRVVLDLVLNKSEICSIHFQKHK